MECDREGEKGGPSAFTSDSDGNENASMEFGIAAFAQNDVPASDEEVFIDLDDFGILDPERPVAGSPVIPEESFWAVPADGFCLAHCVVAAMDPEKWRRTPRHDHGAAVAHDAQAEDVAAAKGIRDAVADALEKDGHNDRAQQLRRGSFPGVGELHYYAAVLGGSIELALLCHGDVEPPRLYGEGPMRLRVGFTELRQPGEGQGVGHYIVEQIWTQRIPAEEINPDVPVPESLHLRGINVQWPFSRLILSGKKTVDVRTYNSVRN